MFHLHSRLCGHADRHMRAQLNDGITDPANFANTPVVGGGVPGGGVVPVGGGAVPVKVVVTPGGTDVGGTDGGGPEQYVHFVMDP